MACPSSGAHARRACCRRPPPGAARAFAFAALICTEGPHRSDPRLGRPFRRRRRLVGGSRQCCLGPRLMARSGVPGMVPRPSILGGSMITSGSSRHLQGRRRTCTGCIAIGRRGTAAGTITAGASSQLASSCWRGGASWRRSVPRARSWELGPAGSSSAAAMHAAHLPAVAAQSPPPPLPPRRCTVWRTERLQLLQLEAPQIRLKASDSPHAAEEASPSKVARGAASAAPARRACRRESAFGELRLITAPRRSSPSALPSWCKRTRRQCLLQAGALRDSLQQGPWRRRRSLPSL